MARLTASGVKFADGDELNSRRQIFPTGSAWIFYQTSAPTGWTKSTAHNDKALRVVSGNGGGSGGTNSFSSMMRDLSIGGSFSFPTTNVGSRTLSATQLPAHTHSNASSTVALNTTPALYNPDGSFAGYSGGDVFRGFGGWIRTSSGTGPVSPINYFLYNNPSIHGHPFSATASTPNQPINISVQYIDVIVCTFDG